MRFDIEASWENKQYDLYDSAVLPVFCSPDSDAYDRGLSADSALDEWYFDSAINAATSYYRENLLDLEGVDFDRFIDDFLEGCTINRHLKV